MERVSQFTLLLDMVQPTLPVIVNLIYDLVFSHIILRKNAETSLGGLMVVEKFSESFFWPSIDDRLLHCYVEHRVHILLCWVYIRG